MSVFKKYLFGFDLNKEGKFRKNSVLVMGMNEDGFVFPVLYLEKTPYITEEEFNELVLKMQIRFYR